MASLENTMKECKSLLSDFGIKMTPDIQHRVIEMYPNDIAIENHIRSIIVNHLERLYGN